LKSGTKNLIIAIVVGVVITLVTGLLDHTPSGLMGASWYGYPLAWLVQMVVAPQYFPWVVRPLRLIADLVFWIVIVWIILFAIAKVKKK
jgi:hypothetical protein